MTDKVTTAIAILTLATVSATVGAFIGVPVGAFIGATVDAPIDAPACTLVLGQDDDARIGVQSHAE